VNGITNERGAHAAFAEALTAGLLIAAALACVWVLVFFRGYGDAAENEALSRTVALLFWAVAGVSTATIAAARGAPVAARALAALAVAVVTPAIALAVYMATFTAACAGAWPAHGCPFS
jgi:hypothetical protein